MTPADRGDGARPDLGVYVDGTLIGDISRSGRTGGRLLYRPGAAPLSTGMPTIRSRYPMSTVSAWLEGLLPDRPHLLRQWRREFGIADEHPVSLLRFVGEEVAGAAQFIRPDRVEQALAPGTLTPVTDIDIADRLRASLTEQPDVDRATRTGRFSLAGAQAKIALHRNDGGWSIPSGRTPTTHIIKPAIPNLVNQEAGEHMAMRAARAIGLTVADSRTAVFDGIPAVVIERYDRMLTAQGWVRIHQEDMAQALGIRPLRKYQSMGGPTPGQITDTIRRATGAFGEVDVRRFVQALIFNWLIVGTDAHAKNYSLLLAGDQARLAPLYDLNSYLPHGGSPASSLSMTIGSTYRPDQVTRDDWYRLAVEVGVESDWLLGEIGRQAAALPDVVSAEGRSLTDLGVGDTLPSRFADVIASWIPHALRNTGL